MPVTVRQFDQLQQMGISLWQRKRSSEQPQTDDVRPVIAIDAAQILQSQLIRDVLQLFNLTTADIELTDNAITHLHLTWQFADCNDIQLANKQLVTPPLSKLQTIESKKQLWQKLSEYLSQQT